MKTRGHASRLRPGAADPAWRSRRRGIGPAPPEVGASDGWPVCCSPRWNMRAYAHEVPQTRRCSWVLGASARTGSSAGPDFLLRTPRGGCAYRILETGLRPPCRWGRCGPKTRMMPRVCSTPKGGCRKRAELHGPGLSPLAPSAAPPGASSPPGTLGTKCMLPERGPCPEAQSDNSEASGTCGR